MVGLGFTLWMLVKVAATYMLLYVFIPMKAVRFEDERPEFPDRFFMGITRMTFITIVVVHFLTFIKLYETFSLIFMYLALYVIFLKLSGKPWLEVAEALGLRIVTGMLDVADEKAGFLKGMHRRFKEYVYNKRLAISERIRQNIKTPFSSLLPTAVVLAAAYLRFAHSIRHASYPLSDTYVHLVFVKYLGLNQIFYSGIYPQGIHAILSPLSQLFFIDPYWVCRFIGPLGGVLLVLSVYYYSLKITKSRAASLIALVFVGLVTSEKFPMIFIRQTTILPQEFSAIFIFPGMHFLWSYLEKKKKQYLYLFSEAFAVTVLMHMFTAVFMALWAAIMIASYWILNGIDFKTIRRLLIYTALSGVIGILPIIVGRLQGIEFHESSRDFILKSITAGSFSLNSLNKLLRSFLPDNALVCAALLLVPVQAIIYLKYKFKQYWVLSISISVCLLFTYLHYRAPELGLPAVAPPERTGFYLSLVMSVFFATGFNALSLLSGRMKTLNMERIPSSDGLFFRRISFAICAAILLSYPPITPYAAYVNEYDAAAENYVIIRSRFPSHDWTIIAPTEQYQQAVGYGWHYEILNFVREFSPEEVGDPSFKMPIPTRHIFIYTEKIPLYAGREVRDEDADMELEPQKGDDMHLQYYGSPVQRTIIQAKAIRLAEAYMKSHSNMEVFYEDEEMRIYHIVQDMEQEGALNTSQSGGLQ